jgi:hypothetical protein
MFKYKSRAVSAIILAAFISTSIKSPAYAYSAADQFSHLPAPGVMVRLSPEFIPAHLQGMTIHPDNALQFDFLIHKGNENFQGAARQQEYKSLVKYFLASLTIPDADQWVNLSPYEKNRIIQDDFGKTEMGRDLLAEDYVLKQITSSLVYPEDGLGKRFWDTIYERAWKEYHTTEIPVNTFNKVWIVPDRATVYESGNTAYILQSHLKVMLEEDYLSLEKHSGIMRGGAQAGGGSKSNDAHAIGSQVIREVILPALEKEVNEGQNFARLRQIYSGMVLAAWYKKRLKESLLGMVYMDKGKVRGVDYNDPKATQAIYHRYLLAFKKGVYNYIKEDFDKYRQQVIPRKYFSGGFRLDPAMLTIVHPGDSVNSIFVSNAVRDLNAGSIDKAMVSFDELTKSAFNVLRLTALGVLTVVGASNAIAQTNELPQYSKFAELNQMLMNNPTGPSFSSDLFGEQSPTQETQVASTATLPAAVASIPRPDKPLPNPPATLTTSEYKASEFLSVLDINALLSKLNPPDAGFTNVENAVNWLNSSIEPYQLFAAYLRKNGMGIFNPDLFPKGFENFTDGDFEQLNRTEQGKKLKRFILGHLPEQTYQPGTSEQNGEYTPVPYNPTGKNQLIFNAKNSNPSNGDFRLGPFHDNFTLGPIHVDKGRLFIPFYKGIELSLGAKAPKLPNTMLYNHMRNQSGGLTLKIPLDIFKKSKGPTPNKSPDKDKAMVTPGGIDLNAANLNLQIQRDGNGVPLPLRLQDVSRLQNIDGFVPIILDIQPITSLPFLSQLK